MKVSMLLAIVFGLLACGDSSDAKFDAAKKVNTVEGWATFLKDNPDHHRRFEARDLQTSLARSNAKQQDTVEAWALLEKCCWKQLSKTQQKNVRKSQIRAAYFQAEGINTLEAWQGFVDNYGMGNSIWSREGVSRRDLASSVDQLEMTVPVVAAVNLAEKVDAEPDGYAVSLDLTNNTGKTIHKLMMRVDYLSESDGTILVERYPLVAQINPKGDPRSELEKTPIKAGETRTFYYMRLPPGFNEYNEGEEDERWNREVRVTPVMAVFGK